MTEEQMKTRTKAFALRVLKLAGSMPRTIEADVTRRQIVRSSGAAAAAYRAACRARSTEDFLYKLSLVEEEADETALWLEMLVEGGMIPQRRAASLLEEANALTAMMVASQKTTRLGRTSPNPKSKVPSPKC